jgi:hypothetical protein
MRRVSLWLCFTIVGILFLTAFSNVQSLAARGHEAPQASDTGVHTTLAQLMREKPSRSDKIR